MIMSSSNLSERQSFYVVQSGVVAWEDPQPIVDWRWKTVSVVATQLSVVLALLWDIVGFRPERFGRLLRCYLAPIPPSMTRAQKRRLMASLKVDPPGFAATTTYVTDTHVSVISVLNEPSDVHPGFLTDYRHCALMELNNCTLSEAEPLQRVCMAITDLGGSGINALLRSSVSLAILRVLDLESHAVIQAIGSSEASDRAIQVLTEHRVRRFHDIRALPEKIAKLHD
jgi:hypothetical protein